MKALILSAGYGERLRPLTNAIPKPLLEVGGRPLIDYALLTVKAAGITEVAINIHHLAEQIEHKLGDGRTRGLAITYSPEAVLTGTGGALRALRSYLAGEAFVILNSDTIMDLDLTDVITRHRRHGGLATLVLRVSDHQDAYSCIEIDGKERIRRMRLLKRRAPGEFEDYPRRLAPTVSANLRPYMYCGVMVCEPATLTNLPPAPAFSLIADFLAPRLLQGAKFFGFVHSGFFRTIDDLGSYETLRAEFARSAPPLACLRTAPAGLAS
jgi:NDP-sugar pyrophosphorylase family protein